MDRADAEAIYDAGRDVCVQFILELAARVERVEERMRRLEEQARRDSRTSSKPPSSDPPKTRQQRRAEARARAKELLGGEHKAGGQPGHRGSGRELRPEDQVDEIVDHYPDACRGCGREFTVDERQPGAQFGRHQVAELPPISVIVIEHRTHRVRCPACQAKTTARLPAGIGSLSIRVQPAGGGGDVDRAQPDLAPGHVRARSGAVRGHRLDRHGRSDLPARKRCARRTAPSA
jgi:hypothetical protein